MNTVTYPIHIAATPDKTWQALTDPEALKNNWGKIESRWTPGSPVTEVDGSGKLLWRGEVRRSERPRLLAFSFDVIGSGEPPTEVKFEITPPASPVAPGSEVVRLTVTQE